MSKKRGRHPKGGRVTPKGTRPGSATPGATGPPAPEPDLMRDVRQALSEDDPLALLVLASGLLTVVDPRRADPFDRDQPDGSLDLDTLLRSFVDIDGRETTALLTVVSELTPDDLLRARIRRALDTRHHPLPVWLTGLGDARSYRTVEMVHVLGDGDNIMVGTRLVGGAELTFVVYVDHNVGTLVKDAFVVPESIEKLIRFMKAKSDDVDTTWTDIDGADARARITDAIATAAITYPPFESDTWPMCRPLVEWAARKLPAGGTGYELPEWSDDDLDAIADRFFASPYGASLDDDDGRDLLGHLLWFGSGYGPADPLRWSPVAVEILLDDWIPRKIVADVEFLSQAPDLLRAFIRFCHDERGIRPALTIETLEAVDRWEPEYQRLIRSDRLQGPAALMAAMGMLGPDSDGDDDWATSFLDDGRTWPEMMIDHLAEAVGGRDVLDRLDTEPLPDEAPAWEGVADDIRPEVAEVQGLADGWCDAVGDVEYRTACRRFLARAAAGDANVFRRGARADTAAAAVCWAVGKANELFTPRGGGMLVKDLTAHFGLKGSASQRANTLLRAGGFPEGPGFSYAYGGALGSPDYLTSAQRRRIIDSRDRFRALEDR